MVDQEAETIALIREIRKDMHDRFDEIEARLQGLSAAIDAKTHEIEMLTDKVVKRLPASKAAALESLLKGIELR